MTGPTVLLDPTAELASVARALSTRPASLAGLSVGILDISKARGNVFLDRVDELLTDRGITVKRYKKPTFTRPAPDSLRQQIAAECNVVVEGLAD
jgi:malonyl CoA-acyl carrier protein transacylase